MIKEFEYAYWSKDIAKILQIGESTLRKWCMALENQGYVFMRGQHNSRAFIERDILVLRRMKELVQKKGITLETASEIVISNIDVQERTGSVPEENRPEEQTLPSVQSDRQNELLMSILERQERLEEQNRKLYEKLEEQQNYINDKLENRDRHLMEALRESQETKKMIALALEQEEQKKKKSIFARIFGK